MRNLEKIIKTKLRKFLNENVNKDLSLDALNFIKEYLNIKSDILLVNKNSRFDDISMSQQMASVKYDDRSNKFIVQINFDDTKNGFVRRLAHELVHAKQMEDGRLKIKDEKIWFDGKSISWKEYKELYHSDEIPKFEEEAFDQERIISNAFWNR
jgi:hypothetical protein